MYQQTLNENIIDENLDSIQTLHNRTLKVVESLFSNTASCLALNLKWETIEAIVHATFAPVEVIGGT